MTDLDVVSLGPVAAHCKTRMPHAGTTGAISDLLGSRTVPSVTAFSGGTLRREAMVNSEVDYKTANYNHSQATLPNQKMDDGTRLSCPMQNAFFASFIFVTLAVRCGNILTD
jgi:hypothetical protein